MPRLKTSHKHSHQTTRRHANPSLITYAYLQTHPETYPQTAGSDSNICHAFLKHVPKTAGLKQIYMHTYYTHTHIPTDTFQTAGLKQLYIYMHNYFY